MKSPIHELDSRWKIATIDRDTFLKDRFVLSDMSLIHGEDLNWSFMVESRIYGEIFKRFCE